MLPNGDVLVAESNTERLGGEIPEPVTLVRDVNSDGKREVHETFLPGRYQPFGMLLLGEWLYVANTKASYCLAVLKLQTLKHRLE
ncbi:MAG: hypothetical protein LC647_16130 [Beggiatoa sp.]|nr:hypothetical protein [Beggiatoa sp.]